MKQLANRIEAGTAQWVLAIGHGDYSRLCSDRLSGGLGARLALFKCCRRLSGTVCMASSLDWRAAAGKSRGAARSSAS